MDKPRKSNLFLIILFIYSTVASIFLTVSGVFASKSGFLIALPILFLPITAYFLLEISKLAKNKFSHTKSEISEFKTPPNKGGVIFFVLVLLALSAIGINNISSFNSSDSSDLIQESNPTPSPLIFPNPKVEGKLTQIKIVISDEFEKINVYQKPNIYSDVVGVAKNRDIFEYVKLENGWYEITLNDKVGYVYGKYAQEINNQEPQNNTE